MNRIKTNWPMALLLAGFAGLMGYQSSDNRMDDTSVSIATVTLDGMFVGLTEGIEANQELKILAAKLEAESEASREEIVNDSEDLELLAPGSPAHQKLQEELTWKTHKRRALIDYGAEKLDVSKSKVLKTVYVHIKEAVAELADEHGYDIVLVDDSVFEFETNSESEMLYEIAMLRVLYSRDVVDITDELVEYMNARYEANRGD